MGWVLGPAGMKLKPPAAVPVAAAAVRLAVLARVALGPPLLPAPTPPDTPAAAAAVWYAAVALLLR